MNSEKIAQDNNGANEWDDLKEVEFIGDTQEANNEPTIDVGEISKEELVKKTYEKIFAKRKALFAFGMATVSCIATVALGNIVIKNKTVTNEPKSYIYFTDENKDGDYAPDELRIGYDYHEYSDQSDTRKNMIARTAEAQPTLLAECIDKLLSDDEKAELGIKGLSSADIDKEFANQGGEEFQEKALEKFLSVLEDSKVVEFRRDKTADFEKFASTIEKNKINFDTDKKIADFEKIVKEDGQKNLD